jgi:two-component sensor histidine kinase
VCVADFAAETTPSEMAERGPAADPASGGGAGGPAASAGGPAAGRPDELWELLLACVGHELHGPLTVIHGHAQLLEASVADPAAAESLEAIRDAVEMMRHLIEDLALITGDGPPADIAEIDARPLLREMIRDLPSLKARTVVEESSRTVLSGDRRRLRQCLLIVLSNADKYAPDGTITVTLGREGDWGVIAVSDEGPGIPENERASVLRPYGRSAATRDRPGQGLGLYIANVLMASMSGRIELMSAPSGGLRAELRLPVAGARHAARSRRTAGGPAPPARTAGFPDVAVRWFRRTVLQGWRSCPPGAERRRKREPCRSSASRGSAVGPDGGDNQAGQAGDPGNARLRAGAAGR